MFKDSTVKNKIIKMFYQKKRTPDVKNGPYIV